MTGYQARALADVPRNILDYAEKNTPGCLMAAEKRSGAYTDPETL